MTGKKHQPARKRRPPRGRKTRPAGRMHTLILLVPICTVIALFVVTFIVQPMTVPTASMDTPPERRIPDTNDTLGDYNLLVGDRLLVDKLTIPANHFPLARWLRLNHPIRRGEIVVFKSPHRQAVPPLKTLIKRVIGLPGETIEIRQNRVFINGRYLVEPYKYHVLGEETSSPGSEMSALTIPPRHYFVMGDNRDQSLDSRSWGTVPDTFIIGKPLCILWSFPDTELLRIAFPERTLRGIHDITQPGDVLTLILYRILYFWKTRWGRMFHFIPRGPAHVQASPSTGGGRGRQS